MVVIKKVGRAKIPITWIKSDASRHVTFTKRKKGLKKKVEELAILCGVEVCMICFGPQAGKPSSTPYSWGLPGVTHVIDKYRSLSKEEQDKKKLDNTSLLEQQIKKLKSELKIKREQNQNLQNERSLLLWDDRLYMYGVDDLKHLAEIIFDRIREVYEKIAYISQPQQDVLQGLGNTIEQHTGGVCDGGINSVVETGLLSAALLNHDLRMPGPFQKLVAGTDSLNNFGEGTSSSGAVMMNASAQGTEHGLINQISLLSLPAYIDKQKSTMPSDDSIRNAYLNMDGMFSTSTDMSFLSSPALSLRVSKQLAKANTTKLHGFMEPHVLSNKAWQQAVGLEPDDHMQCSPSEQPNEQQVEGQWSIQSTVDDGSAMGINSSNRVVMERETYNAIAVQNFNMQIDHTSGLEIHKGSETQACTNALQSGILHLDVRQLAALSNDSQELMCREAAAASMLREGALMWNLEEETPKTNSLFSSPMLANDGLLSSGGGLTALDSIVEEDNKLGMLKDQDGMDTVVDVRAIDY